MEDLCLLKRCRAFSRSVRPGLLGETGDGRRVSIDAEPLLTMGKILLALFLLVFGFNALLGLSLPVWVLGALALAAGVFLLFERFRVRVDRR